MSNELSAKISPSSGPPTCHTSPAHTSKTYPQEQTLVQDESDAERPSKRCCTRCPFRAVQRVTCGLILGACVTVSWAWGTNSAKETLISHPALFFIVWFCSIWNILFFPLYYLCHLLTEKQKQLPTTEFRKCSEYLGEELTVRVVLKGATPFFVLWSLSGYLNLLVLCRISKVDVSAIFCCNQAFVFLLSWIGLKDRFMGVRIVAAILSITGIVMLAYGDGFQSDSITGVALGVGSASASALFKVLFRKCAGNVQPGAASVLLSCVGLCSFVLHSLGDMAKGSHYNITAP